MRFKTIRNAAFKLFTGQDASLLPPSGTWNIPTPADDSEFQPFTEPSMNERELLYEFSTLTRTCIEVFNKDVLSRWFSFIENDESLQERLANITTPQNPEWGFRELLTQALIYEDKYGWSIIAWQPGRSESGKEWFVFSHPHLQNENYDHTVKQKDLFPDSFDIQFKTEYVTTKVITVPADRVIPFVFRPKKDDWKGYPWIDPVYGNIIYLENLMYGYSQAIYRIGVGNVIVDWPASEDLDQVNLKLGTIANKKTVHLKEIQGKKLSDRIHVLDMAGTITDITSAIDKYTDFICAYREMPKAVLFGTPAGSISGSWLNDIQYESTLLNKQEQCSQQVDSFLEEELGDTPEYEWNAGKIIDEGMRAETRTKQLQYMTVNEVREKDNLPPLPEGDQLLEVYLSSQKVEFNFNSNFGGEPTDPDGISPPGTVLTGQPDKPGEEQSPAEVMDDEKQEATT
jgi:hypothetical protein